MISKNYYLFLIMLSFIILSACNNKTFESMEKAISQSDREVIDVLAKEEFEGGGLLLYTTPNELKHEEVLAIAYFKETDLGKWIFMEGVGGESLLEHKDMTIDSDQIMPLVELGKSNYFIVYGEINNPEIQKVKVKDEEGDFKSANVVKMGDEKVYYQILNYNDVYKVRGYTKDHTLIFTNEES